jgi:hypothetical protein
MLAGICANGSTMSGSQRAVGHVSGDADDRQHLASLPVEVPDPEAQDGAVGGISALERFVHDRDAFGAEPIALVEVAPGDDGNPHGSEVTGRDEGDRRKGVGRRSLPTFD